MNVSEIQAYNIQHSTTSTRFFDWWTDVLSPDFWWTYQ